MQTEKQHYIVSPHNTLTIMKTSQQTSLHALTGKEKILCRKTQILSRCIACKVTIWKT